MTPREAQGDPLVGIAAVGLTPYYGRIYKAEDIVVTIGDCRLPLSDCVERVAGEHGLEEECLNIFDEEVLNGMNPADAAWDALYEWDCLALGPEEL